MLFQIYLEGEFFSMAYKFRFLVHLKLLLIRALMFRYTYHIQMKVLANAYKLIYKSII